MRLVLWQEERLQFFAAAELARRHRAAGVLLNQPEAVAIIWDVMLAALARCMRTRRTLVAVVGRRGLTRSSLALNRATVPVDIDVRIGEVSLDGVRLAVAPIAEVPLSRRYPLG